jgi:hypothetical protein
MVYGKIVKLEEVYNTTIHLLDLAKSIVREAQNGF